MWRCWDVKKAFMNGTVSAVRISRYNGACDVAIVGAGPYGLSIAAHLRARGVDFRVFGTPLSTWRTAMPNRMLLKSDGFASSLSAPAPDSSLADYCRAHDLPYHPTDIPVPIQTFIEYGLDFQRRFVPDVEERVVTSVVRNGRLLSPDARRRPGARRSPRRRCGRADALRRHARAVHRPPDGAGHPLKRPQRPGGLRRQGRDGDRGGILRGRYRHRALHGRRAGPARGTRAFGALHLAAGRARAEPGQPAAQAAVRARPRLALAAVLRRARSCSGTSRRGGGPRSCAGTSAPVRRGT